MTNKKIERFEEIEAISKNQLSHSRDLPRNKQVVIGSQRMTVKEIPMDPLWFDLLPSPHPFLPEPERVYVKGREFSIESK